MANTKSALYISIPSPSPMPIDLDPARPAARLDVDVGDDAGINIESLRDFLVDRLFACH
jgi:hypothetical protein